MGQEAAESANRNGLDPEIARCQAAAPFKGFRFHDLRHQAITEMAESGKSDATVMSLAGHLSRRMMEHYSHVRMERKRDAVEALGDGILPENVVGESTASSFRGGAAHNEVAAQSASQQHAAIAKNSRK